MTPKVLRYIAEEVERQRDNPLAVFWMADAWDLASDERAATPAGQLAAPNVLQVQEWGRRVHPVANRMGFRRGSVRVGDHVPRQWPLYLDDLDYLLKGLREGQVEADHAYLEFQRIHPFNDGNGRTGKILLNYVKDTMQDPVMPPNFFGIANP